MKVVKLLQERERRTKDGINCSGLWINSAVTCVTEAGSHRKEELDVVLQ